jgi:hypothetical protein
MRNDLNKAGQFVLLAAFAVLPSMSKAQTATDSGQWQPTHSANRSEDYAGAAACASCHPAQSAKQGTSQMGRSLLLPTEASPDHQQLTFQRGPYKYTLRRAGQASLTVEDGGRKITEPIFAIVGSGEIFQAYLIRHDGAPYRVAVDYLGARGELGLDDEADPPASLDGALGRRHSDKYVRSCFACHSPASVAGDQIDLIHRPVGNTCEVCHGPGAKHAAAERAGSSEETAIFNPGHLGTQEESDFCGQCHTTASAMKAQKPQGVRSVISEPYRLAESRCWNSTDQRISCTACHSPHAAIVRDTAAYDAKCLACHTQSAATSAHAGAPGKECTVGKHDCAGCHMPRVSVPDTPIVYADHRIRIAATGAPYPE